MEAQDDLCNELSSELCLKSKLGLKQEKKKLRQFLETEVPENSKAKEYYEKVLGELKNELQKRKSKHKLGAPQMPKEAVNKLCAIYAPGLKFSKEALKFLDEIIRIETCQVFKKLKTLAAQRNAKRIKVQDLKALAEMNQYD